MTCIALDGPAGCGKSTLGRGLSKALGYPFLDTGILYRAIARHAQNIGIPIYDSDAVTDYAQNLTVDVEQIQPTFQFKLDGKTARDLHNLQIDRVVPTIAANPAVRYCVRRTQRAIAAQGNIIMAGRDIGTVVLPDAEYKFYLDVTLEERANRRFNAQKPNAAQHRTLEQVREDLLMRDLADATRDISPMKPAQDAIIIHSDNLSTKDVVEVVLKHIESDTTRPQA